MDRHITDRARRTKGPQQLRIRHFYKADPAYGTGVAKGFGLNIENIVAAGKKVTAAD